MELGLNFVEVAAAASSDGAGSSDSCIDGGEPASNIVGGEHLLHTTYQVGKKMRRRLKVRRRA